MSTTSDKIMTLAFSLTKQYLYPHIQNRDSFGTRAYCPKDIWYKILQCIINCLELYPEDRNNFLTIVYNTPLWFGRVPTIEEENNYFHTIQKLNLSPESREIVDFHLNNIGIPSTLPMNNRVITPTVISNVSFLCCHILLSKIISIWKRLPFSQIQPSVVSLNTVFKKSQRKGSNIKIWEYSESLHPNFYLNNLEEYRGDTLGIIMILSVLLLTTLQFDTLNDDLLPQTYLI
jgi:hypothetical protein